MLDANVTVHLTLPAGAIAVLMQGLDELKMGLARPVYEEMRRQISEQHPQAFDLPMMTEPVAPPPRVNGVDAAAS